MALLLYTSLPPSRHFTVPSPLTLALPPVWRLWRWVQTFLPSRLPFFPTTLSSLFHFLTCFSILLHSLYTPQSPSLNHHFHNNSPPCFSQTLRYLQIYKPKKDPSLFFFLSYILQQRLLLSTDIFASCSQWWITSSPSTSVIVGISVYLVIHNLWLKKQMNKQPRGITYITLASNVITKDPQHPNLWYTSWWRWHTYTQIIQINSMKGNERCRCICWDRIKT